MDKGTAAYTEFDWDEDVVEYRMENPEAIDWLVGHIHSHNTMNVFFSSTDWSELNDNCVNHNFYVSLIVNNFMEMCAKIAFTAESKPVNTFFTCLDEEGKPYSLSLVAGEPQTHMFVYDCLIKLPYERAPLIDETFTSRLDIVENKGLQKQKAADALRVQNIPPPSITTWNGGYPQTKPLITKQDHKNSWEKLASGVDTFVISLEEKFLCFVIRLGQKIVNDSLVRALEDLEIGEINLKSYVMTIDDNFGAYYDTFFKNEDKKYESPKAIGSVLDTITYLLEENRLAYPFAGEFAILVKKIAKEIENRLN